MAMPLVTRAILYTAFAAALAGAMAAPRVHAMRAAFAAAHPAPFTASR